MAMVIFSISSYVKDKNNIFTARDEDMVCSKRKNPGISLVLYNKSAYVNACLFSTDNQSTR